MKLAFLPVILLLFPIMLEAQTFVANYDESKVPAYVLPDPLVFGNGKALKNSKEWPARRSELLRIFEKEMYGKVPEGKVNSSFSEISKDENACNGLAVRKEVRLILNRGGKEVSLYLLIYLPKSTKKSPVFLGYNFNGNHTISIDPQIRICTSWVRNNPAQGITDNHATEAARGIDAASWPVDEIIKRGYGVATLYYGDVAQILIMVLKKAFTLFLAPAGIVHPGVALQRGPGDFLV